MEAGIPDIDMTGSPGSDASTNSSLAVYEPAVTQGNPFDFNDDAALDFMPDYAPFADLSSQLTAYLSGDANATPHDHNNAAPVLQTPSFDPRALLNPKTVASKRPASSEVDADRGRIDPTIAGQVSLVERLHNVQERTSSPAKRVKTEETRKKTINGSSFSGSALDLQHSNGNGQTPVPQQRPAIDLTMSESSSCIVKHANNCQAMTRKCRLLAIT